METIQSNEANARDARQAQWRRILADLAASGQTMSTFARAHGIPIWKLSYWRKALHPADDQPQRGFVEMRVTSSNSPASVWVEAGRWRVGVAPGFDATTLRQVIEALAT